VLVVSADPRSGMVGLIVWLVGAAGRNINIGSSNDQ